MDFDSGKPPWHANRPGEKLFRLWTKFLVWLIIVPFVLVLTKCAVVHFEHNAAAQRLLVNLQHLPLPQDGRLLYERAEVGNYLSATGDDTDVLAYRVFITDLPAKDISDFFAPFQKGKEFELGVRGMDAPPNSPYLDMGSILQHVPHADRGHAYILYAVDRCSEDGIWDVRGW